MGLSGAQNSCRGSERRRGEGNTNREKDKSAIEGKEEPKMMIYVEKEQKKKDTISKRR